MDNSVMACTSQQLQLMMEKIKLVREKYGISLNLNTIIDQVGKYEMVKGINCCIERASAMFIWIRRVFNSPDACNCRSEWCSAMFF